MKYFFFCSLFVLLALVGNAQSPGGVSTNLTLWLKADNATSITGNPVQNWSTSGGSATGYAVAQSNAANRPTFVNGATNSLKFNYNPRLKFTIASSSRLINTSASPDLLGSSGAAIVVTTNELGTVFTYSSGSTGRYQLKPNFRFQTGNSGTGYTFDWTAPTEYSTTSAFFPCSYGCGSTMALRKNSTQINTASNANLALYYPSIVTGLYIGANNAGEFSDASVAEVILFDAKPSTAEMDRVESYLAIKYGVTRGGNTGIAATFNYVASNGTTVVWDKTANAGFNKDIAGIGRDDNSGLNQKQSISVNNGEALTISIGNGAISSENATNATSFLSDNSFLMWGNNGLAKTFSPPVNTIGGLQDQLNRLWKLQATNFSQPVTIGFESAQITGLGTINNLCLIFDDDGNFTSNALIVGACTATNPTGNRVEFAGISLPPGKPFFTLAHVEIPTQIFCTAPICPGSTFVLGGQFISNATYSWTGPNSFTSTKQIDSVQNASAAIHAGVYTVAVNSFGCITNLSVTPIIGPYLNAIVFLNQTAGTNPMCAGASATFTANPIYGGTNPVYQWKVNGINAGTGLTFSSTSLANNDVLTVELTTNDPCVNTPIVTSAPLVILTTPSVIPAVTIVADKNNICSYETVLFTATASNGGTTPAYQWLINGVNAGTNSATFSTSTLTNNDVVSTVLSSNATCAVPASVASSGITVSVTPKPIAAFTYTPLLPNESEPLVTFVNQSVNAASWNWDFGIVGFGSSLQNPQFPFPAVGDYNVTLTVANGVCTDVITETISILPLTTYFIPNSFTPNGDLINDNFGIAGTGISAQDFEMSIYNTWGQVIFSTKDASVKWNGKSTAGLVFPEGVYVYYFRFKLKNSDELIKKNGNVTLFR